MTAKLEAFLTLSQALYFARQSSYMREDGPKGLDHAPSVILDAAGTIRRASDKLTRLGTLRCNGVERWDAKAGRMLASWSEEDEAQADAAERRAKSRVTEAMRGLLGSGLTWNVEFQGDPRGAPITLRLFVDGPGKPAREYRF